MLQKIATNLHYTISCPSTGSARSHRCLSQPAPCAARLQIDIALILPLQVVRSHDILDVEYDET